MALTRCYSFAPLLFCARPFDEEGVSCSVCHSIESTSTEGIGSYLIAPPALLVRADGTRVREASDDQVLADLPSHYRAMMRPLLKEPEFCAACHKAAVVPEMNKRKWLRSFAVYDEWQQSAFSTETVQPLSRRDRQSCQSCHMQKPKDGIASHRWPGGNTAIPAHYNWPDQFKATSDLLKSVFDGQTIEISADANDDVGVTKVVFAVNDVDLSPDFDPPYSVSYTIPIGATSLTVKVTAFDNLERWHALANGRARAFQPGIHGSARRDQLERLRNGHRQRGTECDREPDGERCPGYAQLCARQNS